MNRFFLALMLPICSFANEEDLVVKRVYGHLAIRDQQGALEEAKMGLNRFPQNRSIRLAYARALSERGEEVAAWQEWTQVAHLDTPILEWEGEELALLESMAWGVLQRGSVSTQPVIQLHALLGSAMTRDARAIPLLLHHLRGSNAMLRAFAVQLAASYGDGVLQEEIIRLFQEEKVWYVRLAVIQAIGQLRIISLKPALTDLVLEKEGGGIRSARALTEEKEAAMMALLQMSDEVTEAEWLMLMISPRATLRQLACNMVTRASLRYPMRQASKSMFLEKIAACLQDQSPDVRIGALNALSSLRAEKQLIEPKLSDSTPAVAITAARALLLIDQKVGEEHLERWLSHEDKLLARMASAAVAVSGKYGIHLAQKHLNASDPYVRANLSWALIGQRMDVDRACATLGQVLEEEKGVLWMWDAAGNPLFQGLAPSRLHHIEQMPQYPLIVDQMTRLEVLSAMSRVGYKGAFAAMRNFLTTRAWGVTGSAAAILLQEGDASDADAVRGLLTDPDEWIRVQAALILAMVGGDVLAVPVLQAAYPHMEREMRVRILEALAYVGHADSIPFLIGILQEPFQILRVVSAAAILLALNH